MVVFDDPVHGHPVVVDVVPEMVRYGPFQFERDADDTDVFDLAQGGRVVFPAVGEESGQHGQGHGGYDAVAGEILAGVETQAGHAFSALVREYSGDRVFGVNRDAHVLEARAQGVEQELGAALEVAHASFGAGHPMQAVPDPCGGYPVVVAAEFKREEGFPK